MTAPSPIPMRDRLRIDYHWTARQRDVLALIARGKTNGEIGDQLGISLDGAKWHVSEILSKLQAESREEAADYWRRYNGLAPRFSRVYRGLTGALATKWIAGAAAVAVAGAATAVIVAIALNQSRNDPATRDTSAPAPAVTPAPDTQQPNPGTNPPPGTTQPTNTTVSLAQPVKSIPNSVMYTVTGCFQCDGPDGALQRHVADANGSLTSTTILQGGTGTLAGWTVGHYAASPDGSVVAAVVCDAEYCGALGEQRSVSNWRVIASSDGGATWRDTLRVRTSYASIAGVEQANMLVATYEGGQAPPIYRVIAGSGERRLATPPGLEVYANPLLKPDGTVLWLNRSRDGLFLGLVRENGDALPLEGADRFVGYVGGDILSDGTIVIFISRAGGGVEMFSYAADGSLLSERDLGSAYRFKFLSPQLGLANLTEQQLSGGNPGIAYPVLLDLAKGTATPITSDIFTRQGGRNTFMAFRVGPFAEVKTGGDCLNVRESASTSAKSLVCHADGVLLRDLGDTTTADGTTWLKVATVDGRTGWASTEFLRR